MTQALQAIAVRLETAERAPALPTTPADQAGELRRELHLIGQGARSGLAHSQAELSATAQDLRAMIGSARTVQDQKDVLGRSA